VGGVTDPFAMAAQADPGVWRPQTPIEDVQNGTGLEGVAAIRVADVKPQRVEWFWPGRIPASKVTVLDGDPGLGKSTITLDLAARASTGSPMPDGARLPGPAGVVLLSAEDGIADTIRPRLEAAGGDCARIVVVDHVLGDGAARPPELPVDVVLLERLVLKEGAGLLVIDPLMAYLAGDVNAHRDQDVRRALHPLKELAERTGAAVVVVRHLNKAPGGNPLYRGGGSIGIVGAARAGLVVALDPDDDARRVLAVTKSNLGPAPTSLAYRVIGDELYDTARIAWEGQSGHKADDLLRVRRDDDDEAPARAEAEDVLREILAEGPVPARKVKQLARDAGISERTLDRARLAVGATTKREGFGPGSRFLWTLPDVVAIDATESPYAPSSPTQETLAPMASMEVYGEDEDPDDPGRWAR